MTRILLVDDEQKLLTMLSKILAMKGFEVETADDGRTALELLAAKTYDVMICDVQMAPMTGIALLRQTIENYPKLPVVMCTAYSSVDTALESLKIGAFDYITKPFNLQELIGVLDRALTWTPTVDRSPRRPTAITYGPGGIVSESAAMTELCSKLERLAPADTSVLFRGEVGVGKKLAGRALHALSHRKDKPFIVVSCSACPADQLANELFGYVAGAFPDALADKDGALIQASGGTVWLDEISALSIELQERLLQLMKTKVMRPGGVTQDLQIDVRILGGTTQNLEPLIRANKFSQSLFARLAPMAQEIQPLRRRREDILPLVSHFIELYGQNDSQKAVWLTPDVQGALMHYEWPGNVLELEACVRYAIEDSPSETITRQKLPAQIMEALSGRTFPDWAIPTSGSPRGQAARKYLESEREAISGQVKKKTS